MAASSVSEPEKFFCLVIKLSSDFTAAPKTGLNLVRTDLFNSSSTLHGVPNATALCASSIRRGQVSVNAEVFWHSKKWLLGLDSN